MVALVAIWSVDVGMNSIGLCIHAMGLYAIIVSKKKSNQSIILCNLSVVEMLAAIYMIVNDSVRLIQYNHDNIFNSVEKMRTVLANKLPPVYNEINFAVYLAL
jgi:hypothetical protein